MTKSGNEQTWRIAAYRFRQTKAVSTREPSKKSFFFFSFFFSKRISHLAATIGQTEWRGMVGCLVKRDPGGEGRPGAATEMGGGHSDPEGGKGSKSKSQSKSNRKNHASNAELYSRKPKHTLYAGTFSSYSSSFHFFSATQDFSFSLSHARIAL